MVRVLNNSITALTVYIKSIFYNNKTSIILVASVLIMQSFTYTNVPTNLT